MIKNEKGDTLRDLVAKEIYFKALETDSLTNLKSRKVLDALEPDMINRNTEKIKQNPAYQRLCRMDDENLRALALNGKGEKLMNSFFSEAAKNKQNKAFKRQQRLPAADAKPKQQAQAGQELGKKQ